MVSNLVKECLEGGVHFGHQVSRWNPKMEKFIFGKKENIYIIDLLKTEKCLIEALDYVKQIVSEGKNILFVGTKRQAQNIVLDQARRCNMPYVNERWLGGTMTNFKTIRRSVDRFKELKKMEEDGTFDRISKKEKSQLTTEKERLRKNLEGIEDMDDLPDALFIVDPDNEMIAVKEAKKLSIPIIAVIDTNCDPDFIDYPIPGNDDAIKSIKLIVSVITDGILDSQKDYVKLSEGVKSEEDTEEESLDDDAEKSEEKKDGDNKKMDKKEMDDLNDEKQSSSETEK